MGGHFRMTRWLFIPRLWLGVFLALAGGGLGRVEAGDFRLAPAQPTLDRWMYPFNFQPGGRPVAPTYGSFDPRFDTRDAEFLLGWDTAGVLATNAGPARYLIRRVRVTLTSVAPPTGSGILPFVYDPTYDSYVTYFATNEPGYVADSDLGRPIELYGVGFRNGFTTATFAEDSFFGVLGPIAGETISIGTRNAYAMNFDTNGLPIDIANHVGQRNAGWTNAPFEVRPWAVGTTTNVVPGGEMPDGGTMTFDVALDDPLVVGYLQRALDEGRLRLMVSSLSPAGQSTPGGTGAGGSGAYPWWATKEKPLYDPPKLEIEGALVTDEDTDADGLPDDWERFWFGDLAAGSGDDPDADGAVNAQELVAGTDPRNGMSVVRIEGFAVDADGRWRLRFPVAPSRSYAVESGSDLVSWKPVEGTVTYPGPGQGAWLSAGPVAGTDSARFVRLRVDSQSAPRP